MFKFQRSFQEFQEFLIKISANTLFANPSFYYTIFNNVSIIFKVFFTDLTPIRKIFLPTYNPRGEKPWDPVCLFRSYRLRCQYGKNGSITKRANKLKSEPFWAILSGFYPNGISGMNKLTILTIPIAR